LNRIQRENQPTEHFICLPLDVPKAAAVLEKRFSAAQLNELVRRLHWRCPDCHPPREAADRWIPPSEPDPFDDPVA
jgi:hypothetical protein